MKNGAVRDELKNGHRRVCVVFFWFLLAIIAALFPKMALTGPRGAMVDMVLLSCPACFRVFCRGGLGPEWEPNWNLFVRVRFGGVPFKVVRVRFSCSLS